MNKTVVHFEIGCSDLQKTSKFYKSVFNWKLTFQGNSAIIHTGKEDSLSGHINSLESDEPQKYITIYIQTDSIQNDLKAIEDNGGKIIVNPVHLPDGRQFAWFEDVAGNSVGLITPLNEKKSST